jgi:RNA polymerase sigma-70 factor (ECF subfamily)
VSNKSSRLQVFLENRAALVEYAAPVVGSRAAAEDVVQEAYFRFVNPSEAPAAMGSPKAYLFKIVRNIAIDKTRSLAAEARRDAQYAVVSQLQTQSSSPEQAADDRETLQQVTAALQELPAETRKAFLMKRFDGATYQEIGERVGVSKATAHRLVQAALVHLMAKVQDSDG